MDFSLAADGRILVRKSSYPYTGTESIIRLDSEGAVDQAFEAIRIDRGSVGLIAPQENGDLIIGGSFGLVNELPRIGLVRLTMQLPTPSASLSAVDFIDGVTFQFKLTAAANQRFRIDVSSDLKSWLPLTNVVTSNSTTEVAVPVLRGSKHDFYRAVFQ